MLLIRRTSLKRLFVALAVSTLSIGAFAGQLNLSQGTWTAAGNAGFTMNKASGAAFSASTYGMEALVMPGYFVMDNWEVNLILGAQMDFSPSFSFNSVEFGFGTSYYFDLDSAVHPYLGMDLTGEALTSSSPVVWGIKATPRVGMLIALNCDVALDLGLRAGLTWHVTDFYVNGSGPYPASANPGINATLGYFGVKGFF